MKRVLSFLVLILCVFTLSSNDLGLSVSNTNFRLYDAYGTRLDLASEVQSYDGLILRTANEAVSYKTNYGEITLGENTLFSIQSVDPENIVFYLVTGEATIKTEVDLEIQIYTPVTLTAIYYAGEYKIVSTDDDEAIYNYSESESALCYDATSGLTYIIEPRTYSSLVNGILNEALDEESLTVAPSAPTISSVVRRLSLPSAPKLSVTSNLVEDIIADSALDDELLAPSVEVIETEKKTDTI